MKNLSFTRLTLAAFATAALGFASFAHGQTTSSKLSANDKKFVKQAYQGGLTEVASAKTAEQKAKNEVTKKVAARLIDDHTKANNRLEEIAKEENLDLSNVQPKTMSLPDDNFDQQYLSAIQKMHEKDIAMFQKEADDVKSGEDRDVPKFARNTLPTLKEHLAMVNDALAKVK
jgi:putative membrane protein